MERSIAEKLTAEFIGTLTLIFVGAGSVVAATELGAGGTGLIGVALAHGLAIGTMVSALGHVSGGHFNPAVTFGAWITQKMKASETAWYIVAQLAGGAAGAGLLRAALPRQILEQSQYGTPLVNAELSNGQAVLIEAILTFFLVWVIFATAIDPEGSFNKVAGLAIGFVITMDWLMGGFWTGAAMNPARSLGPALVGGVWSGWWVYWVGPAAGATVAAVLYDGLILRRKETAGSPAGEAGSPAPDELV